MQYLLLMGLYLQGTQKSIQAWTIHELAVGAALQLGLHSREASEGFATLEREIRKRAWYGVVVLDRWASCEVEDFIIRLHIWSRTMSMTFGRPAAIPDDYINMDLPVDYDELIPSTRPTDPKIQGSVGFFNATM